MAKGGRMGGQLIGCLLDVPLRPCPVEDLTLNAPIYERPQLS